MPNTKFFIVMLVSATISILASCSKPHDERLIKVDSVIDSNPDSAINMLKMLDGTEWNLSDGMYALLLTVKAKDKAFIKATSDSTIQKLLNYYIGCNKENKLHPTVLYYAGRTYSDLGKPDVALRYFRKSEHLLGEEGDPDLLTCIHSQIGGLYFDNHLYRHAFEHAKQRLRYSLMLSDSSRAFNARVSLAFKYRMLSMRDSAELIYKYLSLQADTLRNRAAASQYYTQYASFLMKGARFREADSIVAAHQITWDKGTSEAVLSILNDVDTLRGITINLIPRTRALLNSPDMVPRQQAARELAILYRRKGMTDSAFYYTDLYASLTDSIIASQANSPLAEIEGLLMDAELENRNLLLENKIQSRDITILIVVISLILVLLVAWAVYRNLKHKIAVKESENLALRNERDEIIIRNRKDIERMTEELNSIGASLEESNSDRKKLKASLDVSENRMNSLMAGIDLRETIDGILKGMDNSGKEATTERLKKLEISLSVIYPDFIDRLRQLNLSQRDFDDAMLIKVGIPQKICAAILNMSPTGLSNARARLLPKKGLDKDFDSWADFVMSI